MEVQKYMDVSSLYRSKIELKLKQNITKLLKELYQAYKGLIQFRMTFHSFIAQKLSLEYIPLSMLGLLGHESRTKLF